MHYFFSDLQINGNNACLSDVEQVHHMRNVLRLKPGEKITVCDNAGNAYLCLISSFDQKEAILEIQSRKRAQPPRTRLTIGCAVPKNARMDDIIDKLTQLGVDLIIPVQTARVVVQLQEQVGVRLERWRKISRSAASQSQRTTLPAVAPVTGLNDVLDQARQYDLRLIPTLEGQRQTPGETLAGRRPKAVIALIGPEGDFSPGEVQEAVRAGFIPISMGESVLRVDTAAIAMASYLKLALLENEKKDGDKGLRND
jgi:16S rRNA (uracil1498-N3)-methyltransferase